jgi:hypothetical protein
MSRHDAPVIPYAPTKANAKAISIETFADGGVTIIVPPRFTARPAELVAIFLYQVVVSVTVAWCMGHPPWRLLSDLDRMIEVRPIPLVAMVLVFAPMYLLTFIRLRTGKPTTVAITPHSFYVDKWYISGHRKRTLPRNAVLGCKVIYYPRSWYKKPRCVEIDIRNQWPVWLCDGWPAEDVTRVSEAVTRAIELTCHGAQVV